MTPEKQRLIFISYSRTNRGFALELAEELKASGFRVWFDQLDIPTGSRWDDEIEKALTECEIFMVILTKQSIESHNVKDEIGYAIDSNKRILPILLEEVNVPFRLRRFQYVDFTNKSNNEGIDLAKQLLRSLMDESEEAPSETAPPKVPSRQPELDRSTEQQVEADRLARQRAEAIRKAREREQRERSSQVTPPIPQPERKQSQPQTVRQTNPKLLPLIGAVTLLAILCLGGGYVLWECCLSPTPTPTTVVPATVTPSFTPIVVVTTEAVPTTPAPPSVTIPSAPLEFIRFYWDNINSRNYDLTWDLLSVEFKNEFNEDGKSSYMDTWNRFHDRHGDVVVESEEQINISENEVVVILSVNFQEEKLHYFLRRDSFRDHWLFSLMQNACINAPRILDIGITAEIATARDNVFLRDEPTDGDRIEEMPPGTYVYVLEDAVCRYYRSENRFFWWWKVESPQGRQGWVVEGFDSRDPVFLRPVP